MNVIIHKSGEQHHFKHVAAPVRISQDKSGRAEGVGEQKRWCIEYGSETWPDLPIVIYEGNNVSGTDDDRPELIALREHIVGGWAVQVVTTNHARLTRSYIWFQMGPEMLAHGIEKIHTRHDGMVEIGSLLSDIMAVINIHYIKTMKKALMDRLNANAAGGVAPGSRPFGFVHAPAADGSKSYQQLPEKAEAARWGAEKVLSGWSLSSVAAGWRERGLTGSHGGKITAETVRSALMSPTLAGWRVHRGQIVGRGNWEPILDDATWQAVRAKLSAPRMVDRTDGGTYPIGPAHSLSGYAGRKYALTGGLIICGVCGAPMTASLKQLGKKKGQAPKRVVPYYLCHPSRGGRACTGIMAKETEQHVEDRLWAALDKPEFLASYDGDAHEAEREQLIKKLAGIEARRLELADAFSDPDGDFTMAEYQRSRAGLKASEQQLQAELRAIPVAPPRLDVAAARASREFMTLDEWREFLRLYIDRVTISRARPGLKEFDGDRIDVHFREMI